jgi:hypothetical protein
MTVNFVGAQLSIYNRTFRTIYPFYEHEPGWQSIKIPKPMQRVSGLVSRGFSPQNLGHYFRIIGSSYRLVCSGLLLAALKEPAKYIYLPPLGLQLARWFTLTPAPVIWAGDDWFGTAPADPFTTSTEIENTRIKKIRAVATVIADLRFIHRLLSIFIVSPFNYGSSREVIEN